ncbi:hypothetical protein F4781DRAFT_29867 [Annulohypoxylon bovei var. microspora]|nr:hypothetical protein F4781DRAFT_29867 [Annulohypoxylon bovei var. microspora]
MTSTIVPPSSKLSVNTSKKRQTRKRKRDRTNEIFSKNIQSLMRRMDKIRRKYHVDVYFCTKYRKYFEYSSSPSFRPRPENIVGQLSRLYYIICQWFLRMKAILDRLKKHQRISVKGISPAKSQRHIQILLRPWELRIKQKASTIKVAVAVCGRSKPTGEVDLSAAEFRTHGNRIHGSCIHGSHIQGSRFHGNRIHGSRIEGGSRI